MILGMSHCLDPYWFHKIQNSITDDFLCRIRFGNLMKDYGDILLCPVSRDFRPSNPLAHRILKKEKQLKKKLENFKYEDRIGTKHTLFLPCKRLHYRGIIFVSLDFYSTNRAENNAMRLAEAFLLARKYNCTKLSCSKNILYESDEEFSNSNYEENMFKQIRTIIEHYNAEKMNINFIVDIVLQRNFENYLHLAKICTYDYSHVFAEKIPACSEILPWYRRKLHSVIRATSIDIFTAYKVRRMLCDENISEREIKIILKRIYRKFGDWYESSCEHVSIGYESFILNKLIKELPWNFKKIKSAIEDINTELYENYTKAIIDSSTNLESLIEQEYEINWDACVSLRHVSDVFFRRLF